MHGEEALKEYQTYTSEVQGRKRMKTTTSTNRAGTDWLWQDDNRVVLHNMVPMGIVEDPILPEFLLLSL